MTKSNSELQVSFGEALIRVKATTTELVTYLSVNGRASWIWRNPLERESDLFNVDGNPTDLQQSLSRAGEIISAFWYADGQDAREVRLCPGLIAVEPRGIELAHTMNEARRDLAHALAAMEGRVEVGGRDSRSGLPIERPLREVAQEAYQAARLQYQQATRAIVTLNHAPEYAGFTWANCRKVFRTTAGDVRKTITDRIDPERPDPLSLMDLKSLQNLSDSYPLAVVRPASLTPKVNLAWTDSSGNKVRTIKRSVLPLLYVGDALPERLYELPPSPTLPRSRSKRSDVELEEHPFLSTVVAHRYLDNRS